MTPKEDNAFCAADPQWHWARFMKGGE